MQSLRMPRVMGVMRRGRCACSPTAEGIILKKPRRPVRRRRCPSRLLFRWGNLLFPSLGGIIVSLTGFLLLWTRIFSVGCLLLLQPQRLEAIVYFLGLFFHLLIFLQLREELIARILTTRDYDVIRGPRPSTIPHS